MSAEAMLFVQWLAACALLIGALLVLDALERTRCARFACDCKVSPAARRFMTALDAKRSFLTRLRLACLTLTAVGLMALTLAAAGSVPAALLPAAVLTGVFYLISYLKFNVLKEPLYWSDLMLVKEALLCPRFYFGYVKPALLGAGLCTVCALTCSELLLLRNKCQVLSAGGRVSACFLFLLSALLLLWCLKRAYERLERAELISGDTCLNGAELGTLTAFLLGVYELLTRRRWPEAVSAHNAKCARLKHEASAVDTLIVLQAESLVSLKRLQQGRAPGTAALTDDYLSFAKGASLLTGLNIDYFGAYTMRSEFALLTGLEVKTLGAYCSDPYLLLEKTALPALPALFKAQGFHTLGVHLNSGRFFKRSKVLPQLGFSECVFAENLPERFKTVGSSPDAVLGLYLKERVQQARAAGQKLLVFAITLEGHGPYQDKSSRTPKEIYASRQQGLQDCVKELLPILSADTRLIIYGDHLPPLPGLELQAPVQALLPEVIGFNFKDTELSACMNAAGCAGSAGQSLSAHALNALLLKAGGLYA